MPSGSPASFFRLRAARGARRVTPSAKTEVCLSLRLWSVALAKAASEAPPATSNATQREILGHPDIIVDLFCRDLRWSQAAKQ